MMNSSKKNTSTANKHRQSVGGGTHRPENHPKHNFKPPTEEQFLAQSQELNLVMSAAAAHPKDDVLRFKQSRR